MQEIFDKNREDSARVTVKTVFLKMENDNWDALKDQAYAIKDEILKGASIDTFIAQESDYTGNNAGQFVVVSSSSFPPQAEKVANIITAAESGQINFFILYTSFIFLTFLLL